MNNICQQTCSSRRWDKHEHEMLIRCVKMVHGFNLQRASPVAPVSTHDKLRIITYFNQLKPAAKKPHCQKNFTSLHFTLLYTHIRSSSPTRLTARVLSKADVHQDRASAKQTEMGTETGTEMEASAQVLLPTEYVWVQKWVLLEART